MHTAQIGWEQGRGVTTGSVPDPLVFGPSGSGSFIICTDPDLDPEPEPDPSIIKQK